MDILSSFLKMKIHYDTVSFFGVVLYMFTIVANGEFDFKSISCIVRFAVSSRPDHMK